MSKRESIARYTLIIKKLRKHPASFEQIADYLALESELQDYNFNISKRTFQRDIKDILSLYNIEIEYDFSNKVYKIGYDENPDVNERILEAFDTFNALNLSDRLSNAIHFEKRRPLGTENLYGLLHAIKNKLQVEFTYENFWEPDISERETEPYGLKEFRNRWYLLAKDLRDEQVKSFGLDRLTDLDITQTQFSLAEDFDVEAHYQHCFGIVAPNQQAPEEVILSFTPHQGQYVKSLPLHLSQEILEDNEYELRIQLKVYITHDFLMELLAHGDTLKVIQPQSLEDELKSIYRDALKRYGEDKVSESRFKVDNLN
ncbi:helix-turn-helix transcriptional regulator [Psychroflexus tropicus]|uniref:helix-turn-helix transcriptional regulator n=1 Tax=Psychroflexus tropicus TaxID=197345 RepID=UPI000381DAB6|nr:WYL domain-containing protein [Psychroflexus tropicus]